ncbi:Abhydrolase_2 domain-containing protein [Durusdinium trenchii]|uniref:Abhydrolase_2 domain-containing protein n=1 Tax=Durusdinium trenchii TaxID=1381693 RepID=A0ABP0M2B6_9DINO
MGLVQCGCCTPTVTDEITDGVEGPEPLSAPQADPLASAQTLVSSLRTGSSPTMAGREDSFATLISDRSSFRTLVPDRGSFSTMVPERKSFDTVQPSRASFGTLMPDRLSFQAPVPESDEEDEGSEFEAKPPLYADSLEAQAAVPKAPQRGFLGRFASIRRSMGELSALQITADVHARAMRYAEMSSALEKALTLAEALGDVVTEASLNISLAQAQMGLLEVSSMQPKSDTFQMQGALAAKAAKRAVALARRQQRSDLIISALCALSQTQFLVGEKQAARSAAKAAASLAKGQPLTEATALVLAANSCIAMGKTDAAKEAASNALYLFEEVKDYVGQDLAKATLDAIDNPVSAVSISGKMRLVRKRKTSVNAEALRQKVRNVVSEIVGMDALMDDTPLMQSGLTSQSAVLLRNALSNEIPGPSLPFTLMFDYPSITDLSAFFVESAGGEEEEVEEWVEDTSAAGARKAGGKYGQRLLQRQQKAGACHNHPPDLLKKLLLGHA